MKEPTLEQMEQIKEEGIEEFPELAELDTAKDTTEMIMEDDEESDDLIELADKKEEKKDEKKEEKKDDKKTDDKKTDDKKTDDKQDTK